MQLSEAGSSWLNVAIAGKFDPSNPFLRFMAAWISFNALYEELTPSRREYEQIIAIANSTDFNGYHQASIQHEFYVKAIDFIQAGGVRDARSGRKRKIDSEKTLPSVLASVYQIRCNLFHGGKHTDNDRDVSLCAAGFIIVGNLMLQHTEGKFISEFENIFS